MFRKILIANRGEIAVRVIRACRELGTRSVAVFSEADRLSPHVRLADEAVCIGPPPARESYLHIEKLIDAARKTGAEAVHPGYGFLAENADFAQACQDAGLVFIGPHPEAMRRLGSKTEARAQAHAAGVPVVTGSMKAVADLAEAERIATEIGYPIVLKAVAGGGGKGMRVVRDPEDLPSAFRASCSEALSSFADGSVYVEKYVDRPRHVEVQVLGDLYGNLVYLGERDCSVQRRHQKLVEESPSPAVDPDLRRRMGEAAVQVARTVGYTNAGTVEFLLDREGRFYFLEVNARIQVEHPVTEMVAGLDLVQAQVRIAAGERLGLSQEQVQPRGWAMEFRIYAEDPANGFLPSVGELKALREPAGPGVRVDSGVEPGLRIGLHYDALMAKLIVWGEDRERVLARARRALREYYVLGVQNTLPFHRFLVEHPAFQRGDVDTGFVEREWRPQDCLDDESLRRAALAAAVVAHLQERDRRGRVEAAAESGDGSRWRTAARVGGLRRM